MIKTATEIMTEETNTRIKKRIVFEIVEDIERGDFDSATEKMNKLSIGWKKEMTKNLTKGFIALLIKAHKEL